MAAVSSLGVGSNLELDKLLDNLSAAERTRLTPISNQQSANNARLSAYGALKSTLESFQSANNALNNGDLFKSVSASSNTEAISVIASPGSATGVYEIKVSQLARAQTLATRKVDSSQRQLGETDSPSRVLHISQGGKTLDITLSAQQTSLSGIRDAINNAGTGISASIIKVDDSEYRLTLTTETGAANALTISVDGDDKLNALLGWDSASNTAVDDMELKVQPQNALLTVNGLEIERQGNTITDAPQGITLTLNEITDVTNARVVVSSSNEPATEAIHNWVAAYNTLVDTINSFTHYTPAGFDATKPDNDNGVLLGESATRVILSGIRGQFSSGGGGSSLNTLAEIGISQNPKTGKLEIDDNKLQNALNNDPIAIRKLLAGDGAQSGISDKIAQRITAYLADDGVIENARQSINARLKSLTQQYISVSASIDATIARYKAQFIQLDKMMNQLTKTSEYLTQQFAAMNKSSND